MLLLSILFQFGIAWLLLTDLNGMKSDSGNTINKEIEKKRALVIAPNFLEVHFKMLSVFANVLTEEFNVHFLILNTKNEKDRKNFNRGIDTKIFKQGDGKDKEGGNTYQFISISDDYPKKLDDGVNSLENKFLKRGDVQNIQILRNEAYTVFKDLFDRRKDVIYDLQVAKFDLGFFDTWDTGALFIFHEAGIKNVFGINNTQLNAYQFKYAGKDFPKNVPEIYSARIGDNELFSPNRPIITNAMKGRQREIHEDYERSLQIFTSVHKELDKWFKQRYEKSESWQKPPTTQGLYSMIKGIFLNGHELFDFPLGENKPENVFYVGGIHLKEFNHKKEPGSSNKQVIMSIEYCRQISQPETIKILEKIVAAFEKLSDSKQMTFIYDCKVGGNDLQKLEQVMKDIKHEIKKIPDMQEELAKGNTILLITNSSGYQVLEAFYENVPILSMPYMVDQFYVAETLKIPHEIEIENPDGEKPISGGSPKHGHGTNHQTGNGRNNSPVRGRSPAKRRESPAKGSPHAGLLSLGKHNMYLAPTLSFNDMSMDNENIRKIEAVLEDLLDINHKAKVNKVHEYLHQTLKKNNPKNIFLAKVIEALHGSAGENGQE
uniref:glucuronosyltransferase n=1 Tax=Meloidogyne incognita TaxID=6306 RepID=A0A914LKL0_MELIC